MLIAQDGADETDHSLVVGEDAGDVAAGRNTGAARVRLPGSSAEALGVDLSDVEPGPPHVIGGTETHLYEADVSLACAGVEWQATVSFCTPDFAGFGLAGLRGFFDTIYVGIDGYVQLVELEPHDDRLRRLNLDSTGRPYR